MGFALFIDQRGVAKGGREKGEKRQWRGGDGGSLPPDF